MPQFSPEQRHEIMAAVDALLMQVSARVPLYQNAAGTVLVPLHPLLDTAGLDLILEATALTLLHVHSCTLAQGGIVNRNELVDNVSSKTDMKKSEASKAVDAVFDAIAEALKGGDEVRLVGFGTFSVASRAASEGRNPRTGEKIQIAASKQAKFKPGKGLRDSLN